MNALMTIQVRVVSGTALAQLAAVDKQMEATKRTARSGWGLPWLSKWGNQVQWAGRQLIYNFTLPLAIAGIAASKWALDNEKAMTRVAKVYGDGSKQFNKLSQTELPALGDAFEALSNRFGVARADVINIGADWAAAGASGIKLAKATELTLRTMVLGELQAGDATKQLIAIQAQYGQSVGELSHTIDVLNMVENQTGASMADLMDGMARASGVARTTGVDVEHLAAMIAALTPSAGSAANAGNGLKTILSRLVSPTSDATKLLGEMGIQVDTLGWNSLTGTQRIEKLADATDNLSSAQKAHAATVLGSRYQLNRFLTLMQAVRNENSYYNKSLRATASDVRVYKQAQFELNKVLESNPQRVKQAWVMLQNAATDAVSGLLPYISYLAYEFAKLTQKLADLSPQWQKLILFGAIFLALIGPVARYVGSVTNLFGLMAGAVHGVAAALFWFGGGILKVVLLPLTLFNKALIFSIANLSRFGLAIAASASSGVLGSLGKMLLSVINVMKILPIVAFFWATQWRTAVLIVLATGQTLWPALLAGQRLFTSASIALWGVWQRVVPLVFEAILAVQTAFNAASIALWLAWQKFSAFIFAGGLKVMLAGMIGWVANIGTVLRTIPLLFSATFLGVGRILMAARVAQYVWTALMFENFKAFIFRVGTLFSLLPYFIGRAMSALYVFATVPGVLSGLFLRGWSVLTTAMVTGWGAATRAMAMIWATTGTTLTRIWAVVTGTVSTMSWALMRTIVAGYSLLSAIAPLIFELVTNPWILAGVAIIGATYMLRDKIAEAWSWISDVAGQVGQVIAEGWNRVVQTIINAFYALPEGVQNAMLAVLNIVKTVAMQVYEWMSYLNPFARHSPSLVDNVTRGMDVILGQFARLSAAGAIFKAAYAHLAAYKKLMGGLNGEFKDDRKQVVKSGGNVPLFDSMIADLKKLYPLLNQLEAAYNAQSRVVDAWSARLDAAQNKLDALTDAYNRHKDAMQAYADAPIKGMRQMSDAIFENEMAQKKLNLRIMEMEKAGASVDDLRNRLAALYGDIEMLRGKFNDLRMSGAGSDVLGPLQDQIAAMEAQAEAVRKAAQNSPVDKLQQQLDELQKQGEILQLQNDIKYDPMIRTIDQLANAQKELSYDEIVAGIEKQRRAMDALQPAIDKATATHDHLQRVYDREKAKLDAIDKQYQKTKDVVSSLEQALHDMGSAASQANSKAADAAKSAAKKASAAKAGGAGSPSVFAAGKGANWPDPGGMKGLARKNLTDQSDQIQAFADQQMKKMDKIMSSLNPFAPLKEWWTRTWDWIKEHVGPYVHAVIDGYATVFSKVGDIVGGSGLREKALSGFTWISDKLGRLWKLVAPDAKKVWDEIRKAGVRAWKEIGPEVEELWNTMKDFFHDIWPIAKPVLQILGVTLLFAIKMVASTFANVLGPVLNFIIDVIKAVIEIVKGLINIIKAAFTGDINSLITGFGQVFKGTFELIWAVIKGVFSLIVGVIKGFVNGVVGFFQWLSDVLVGHSIVPDMMKAIWETFKTLIHLAKWIWDHVIKPAVKFFKKMFDLSMNVFNAFWPGIKTAFKILWSLGKWLWEHVLQPSWEKVKHLWELVKPELSKYWNRIVAVWNALKALGRWFWDNVLSIVFEKAKSLWADHVKPELAKWWDRVTTVWNALKALGGWIKNNVMDPIFDAFKNGWERVKNWMSDAKEMLVGPANAIVNAAIKAVNGLIGGLNKISSALPGIDFHISSVQLLASGGPMQQRRVAGGFKTNGARAIVGEGKKNWPEYVIPTDPTYRSRARMLLASAAAKVGFGHGDPRGNTRRGQQKFFDGVPAYDLGGILGGIGDIAKGTWKHLKDLPKNLATVTWAPFKAAGQAAVNRIGWSIPRGAAQYGLNKMTDWVTMANNSYTKAMDAADKKYAIPKGGNVAVNDPRNPAALSTWHGGTFSNLFIAHLEKAQELARTYINVIQGGWRPPTSYSGDTHSKDALDTSVNNAVIIALRRVGIAAGDRTGLGDWMPHVHAIPGPGAGYAGGQAVWQWQDYMARGGMKQPLNSPWGLAKGAIIKARRGGVLTRIGEGNRDEAVLPLPKNWKTSAFQTQQSSGDTVIQINGNLEFPNITDGNDASEFISNLKILAKGA